MGLYRFGALTNSRVDDSWAASGISPMYGPETTSARPGWVGESLIRLAWAVASAFAAAMTQDRDEERLGLT